VLFHLRSDVFAVSAASQAASKEEDTEKCSDRWLKRTTQNCDDLSADDTQARVISNKAGIQHGNM